ncbi:MAG: helix-turn-helix transcriptional regulator [Bacteroidales bacterium]|jgi:putative transcriptional regulator|nr:helix-turn-helix transcriptional regulator [Bacteroidales bacterium]
MKNSIKVERARLDMTQQDLADALEVSRQTINAIEKGKFNPSTILALKISSIFQKGVNEIFTLEESD